MNIMTGLEFSYWFAGILFAFGLFLLAFVLWNESLGDKDEAENIS